MLGQLVSFERLLLLDAFAWFYKSDRRSAWIVADPTGLGRGGPAPDDEGDHRLLYCEALNPSESRANLAVSNVCTKMKLLM